MTKVNEKQIKVYFSKHVYSTYDKLAKEFNVSSVLIRKKFGRKIVSSLNNKGKYIIYVPNHTFDSNGLKKIKGILFSQLGSIKGTLKFLISSREVISSKELYAIIGFNVRQQISQLIKDKEIFTRKKGQHSLYSLKPLQGEIVKEEEFNIISLKEDDKVLKHLQIIKELKENKKIDVARKHNISVETVRNIEERFNKEGVKGLIHTRKPKTINISSVKEAAIIAEAAKHPGKKAKEIKESLIQLRSTPIKTINDTMKKANEAIGSQKKILLELQ